ncbi:MAG: phosphate ABC transporter substrate-binding/OmpA family protein [Rhodobacteraceae bacterium]|nr:phosphate ABC transporter substrate-binding/OmpA family protein [Paracoccaceae bacterium]
MASVPWWCRLAAAAVGLALAAGSVARAADVTLLSRDGQLRIDGQLVQFDGEFYRVKTAWGPLTVDATGVLCDGPGCPDLTAFVAEAAISGPAEVTQGLLPGLIDAFAQTRGLRAVRTSDPDGRIVVEVFEPAGDGTSARLSGRFRLSATSSAEGFADLVAAEADVAVSLREVLPDEVDVAAQAGLGRLDGRGQGLILALDALVPAVAADAAPVTGLTSATLAAALAGDIADWGPLGGPAGWPVTLYLPPAQGALDQVLTDRLLQVEGRLPAADARRPDTATALADALSRDAFGLGVVPRSALGRLRPLALHGACGIPVVADADSLKSEDWPLTTPVYAYVPQGRAPALVREFLAFTQGSGAAAAVQASGFVDLQIARRPFATEGRRLASAIAAAGADTGLEALQEMVGTLSGADRLTVAFRFAGGSADLDAPSRANVALLAGLIAGGAFDGETLVFTGFSDGDGPAEANLTLSRTRAATVLRAVRAAAETAAGGPVPVDFAATGFGEASPLACDDSPWGRQVNRRVEVWVRPGTGAL